MLLPNLTRSHALNRVRRRLVAQTRISYQSVGSGVAVLDLLTITLGSTLAQTSYAAMSAFESYDLLQAFGIGLMCSLLYIPIVRSFGAYRLPVLLDPTRVIRQLVMSCIIVVLAITGILFLLKVGSLFSRGALLGYSGVMLVLCLAERFIAATVVARLVARDAIAGKPAFLIGDREEIDTLNGPKFLRQFGLSDVGRFYLQGSDAGHVSIESQISAALAVARRRRPQEFVIALRNRTSAELRDIEQAMRQTPLPVKLLPSSNFRSIIERRDSVLSGLLHCLELQRAPLSRSEQISKRALDLVGAAVALAILTPVLVIAALAIKLNSPGPVIFRQKRNGFDEVPFTIFKFRTMTVLEDGDVVVQASVGDARITPVGAFLRKTSIDELPQLLNVLRGDMSLVGPRPHAMVHDKAYRTIIGDYFKRHHVKPGMTGWAQVHGLRGETAKTSDMQRRVEYDLWYIDHWSLALECYILFRTAFSLAGNKAY